MHFEIISLDTEPISYIAIPSKSISEMQNINVTPTLQQTFVVKKGVIMKRYSSKNHPNQTALHEIHRIMSSGKMWQMFLVKGVDFKSTNAGNLFT